MKTRIVRTTLTLAGTYQYPLYPQVASSLPSPYPPVANAMMFPADAGEITTTTDVGGGTFYMVPAVASPTYNEPASDESGVPVIVQTNLQTQAPYVKVLELQGNNQNSINSDIFLQIWSFPKAAATETDTLVNDNANSGATLVFSQRILDNYQFVVKIERGIVVQNCIIAVSLRDGDNSKPFYYTGLTQPVTVNIEIEETSPIPV